jgi:hypothetical protein
VGGVDERGTEGETDGGQLEESVEFAEWRWSDLECGPLNVPVPRPRSRRWKSCVAEIETGTN